MSSSPLDPSRRPGTQPLRIPTGGLPVAKPAPTPAPAPQPRGTAPLKTDDLGWFHNITGRLHKAMDEVADGAKGVIDAAGDLADHELAKLGNQAGDLVEHVAGKGAGDKVRSTVTAAGHTLDKEVHKAGDIVRSGGHLLGEAIEDPQAAAKHVTTHVLNGALGKPIPKYKDEKLPGLVGEITQRLAPGHGAYASVGGGATFPSETVATVLSLGCGGEAIPDISVNLRATGSVERRQDGKIRVVVSMRADESASWNAGAQIDAGFSRNGKNLAGVHLGAGVSAEVKATQLAQVELTFDPNNPADAERMSKLIDTSMVPPGANINPAALAECFKANGESVTVGGKLAAKLGVHVEASGGLGTNDEDSKIDEAKGEKLPDAQTGKFAGFDGKSVTQTTDNGNKGAKTLAGTGVVKPSIDLSAKASMGINAGGAHKVMRDGSSETMLFVGLTVEASAKGSIPLMKPQNLNLVRSAMKAATGQDTTMDDVAALKVDQNPDGSLKTVAFEITHVDAQGKTVELDTGDKGLERRKATTGFSSTKIELTPKGMAALTALGGAPSPDKVAQLLNDPGNFKTTHKEASSSGVSYGGHFTAITGVGKIDLHGDAGGGVYQVRAEDGEDLDIVQRDLLLNGGQQ